MLFARVVLPLKLPELFSWSVPEEMRDTIRLGSLVCVSLKHKPMLGFVMELTEQKPSYATKPILEIFDNDQFSLTSEQISLWQWLAEYYVSSLSEVMLYAYPSLFLPEKKKYSVAKSVTPDILPTLPYPQERVLRFLLQKKSAQTEVQMKKRLDLSDLPTILDALEQNGFFKSLAKRSTPKKEHSSIATHQPPAIPALSAEQGQALREIEKAHATDQQVVLLYGVTGAGKTNVYMEMIRQQLEQGKQVLFLIPEIILAEQLLGRLQHFFPSAVHIYHSKITDKRRKHIWQKVKAGSPCVILGTMSSIFLPFHQLSLVICDEEHDTSYKQQVAPFYHSRDVGIMLANFHRAKVVLGSATPSLETFYHAQQGKYGYVQLTKKYSDIPSPLVNVFDLKSFVGKNKPALWIAPPIQRAITQTLNDKRQMLIFQNRRGYAPYVICNACGHIPQCSSCNTHLVYHKDKKIFICHYCGSNYTLHSCPSCLQPHSFVYKRAGTQRVEEVMQSIYPNEKMYVLDKDSTKKKSYTQEAISAYTAQKYHILIGTQIVTKGFDFEHLQLIVVPDFDLLLQFNDFRNNERVMQQMEQVAGRAGRTHQQGEIWVQTNNPNYPLLQYVKSHDYTSFVDSELEVRKQFSYPPFVKLIYIVCSGTDQEETYRYTEQLLLAIRQKDKTIVVAGPAELSISKIRNRYFYHLVLKCDKRYSHYVTQKHNIRLTIADMRNARISVEVNVDPI